MILIYTNTSTPRLQYICKFIFKEQLGAAYSITTHADAFGSFEGLKINYSHEQIRGADMQIRPHPLLFEQDIRQQNMECFDTGLFTACCKITHSDIPFDMLAAAFYLLSRYEEYLPHEKDMYGRFAHENALAYKNGFLTVPLINTWIQYFEKLLISKHPGLVTRQPAFNVQLTYDIDIAWSYRHKGLARNLGGFFVSPSLNRLKVLFGLKQDPFDSYDYLDKLHEKSKLRPIYFFLVAGSGSRYDKNISPAKMAMQALIKKHASAYTVGIHPSWRSNRQPGRLVDEKKLLESICGKAIFHSRQHYIRFSLPETFDTLLKAGIEHEYSMGYGSINGFRASTASPFYWYDLTRETTTNLRIHPFCFMDANSHYEQKQNAMDSLVELEYYYEECKKVNGQFIPVFHNNFLGNDPRFKGWKEMYSDFTSRIQQ
jgi:hypothetical protein